MSWTIKTRPKLQEEERTTYQTLDTCGYGRYLAMLNALQSYQSHGLAGGKASRKVASPSRSS